MPSLLSRPCEPADQERMWAQSKLHLVSRSGREPSYDQADCRKGDADAHHPPHVPDLLGLPRLPRRDLRLPLAMLASDILSLVRRVCVHKRLLCTVTVRCRIGYRHLANGMVGRLFRAVQRRRDMSAARPARRAQASLSPWQIPLSGWWRALMRVARRIGEDMLWIECAGVAFFALLSLFPALVLAVTTYGLVTDAVLAEKHLTLIADILPEYVHQILENRVRALVDQPDITLGLGLLVSLAVALWSASRGMNTIILVSSHAYRERDRRRFVVRVILSLVFTIGAGSILTVSLIAIAIAPAVLALVPIGGVEELVLGLARWPILAAAILAGLFLLYRFAPDRRAARWRWVLPGALLSTVGWLLFSFAFSFYVETVPDLDAVFGSLSAIVVLMLWLYYSVMVVVIGALLNAELEYQTAADTTRGSWRPMGERGAYVADHAPDQND